VDGGRASTIAIWVVAGALALFAGLRLLGGNEPAAAPIRVDAATSSRPAAGGAGGGGGLIYVHVAGAVRRPGLIRVPPDSRVAAALDRAGGPLRRADLTLVNLAAKVQDGQQIVVPVAARGAPGAAAAASAATPGAGPPGMKIHLSTATAEELDEIDGIGPELAGRIIEYRDAHGGFRSLAELGEVDGIGEKRLATLRDALQP
jgi:competence protein ComEA